MFSHKICCDSSGDRIVWIPFLCVVAGLMFAGCPGASSNGQQRTGISGTVNFEGTPIRYGVIQFVPDAGQNLPASSLEIREGAYQSDAGKGLPAGTYRVEITGWSQPREEISAVDQATGSEASRQIIPEKYNTRSELKLAVETTKSIQKNFVLTK